MSKKKDDVVSFEAKIGMTLYTDAGTRPNPGFGGCGIHGYIYSTQPATKGVGLGAIVPSSVGYYDKSQASAKMSENAENFSASEDRAMPLIVPKKAMEFHEKFMKGLPCSVTTLSFIDSSVPMVGTVTNNESEATAIIRGMQLAMEKKVSYLHIASDSKYALNGITKWAKDWQKNGWRRSDGSDVPNAETWVKALKLYRQLQDSGITVNFSWVRGHAGETGNERADISASVGVYRAARGEQSAISQDSDVAGYWNGEDNRHPLINHRFCYFNTREDAIVPGMYYQGNQGKDEELVGNRRGDAGYSVVCLDEPDQLIEKIRNTQAKFVNNADSLFLLYLGNASTPNNRWMLNTYGADAFVPPKGYRCDLVLVDDGETPICREFKPARIAMRAVDELEKLSQKLSDWCNEEDTIKVTDVTDVFYDIAVLAPKKAKKGDPEATSVLKHTLKSNFVVGTSSVRVNVNHPFMKDASDSVEITLVMGIDILDRNSLKRLEDRNPQVFVITWGESEKVFRYATIVKAGKSLGIWAGVYANLRILP